MIKKLFAKNFAMTMIALILPTLLLGCITLYITNHHVQEEIYRQNELLLNEGFEVVENTFKSAHSLSLNLGMRESVMHKLYYAFNHLDGDISSSDYEVVTAILDFLFAIANSDDYIQSLYLYIPNNQQYFLNSYSEIVTLSNFADITWYDSFMDGSNSDSLTWVEERTVSRFVNDPRPLEVLSVYRRISSSRFPDGVLVMNLSMAEFERTFNKIVHSGDFLLMGDPDKVIVSNSSINTYSKSFLKSVFDSGEKSFTATDGSSRYIIWKQNSKYVSNGQYVSIIDISEAYKIPNIVRSMIFLIMIILIVIASIAAYRMTKRSINLIDRIVGIIKSGERGELQTQAVVKDNEVTDYIVDRISGIFNDNKYLNLKLIEKDYKLQSLEFLALRSQIRPHFLYNTLEIIKWKSIALAGGPNNVSSMLENLSGVLRYSFTDSADVISVSQEITALNYYVNIQKTRYEHFSGVTWKVSDEASSARLNKFFIQPMLENCLQHGSAQDRDLSIDVDFSVMDGRLNIKVADNGIGISAEKLSEIENRINDESIVLEHHIGLANTNRRIKLLYGNEYGLSLESAEGVGTTVLIVIPLIKGQSDKEVST
jgi:two-component system sensor histidine kinase YesM